MFADVHVHTVMKYVHNGRSNLWRSFWGPIRFLGFINNLLGIPAFSQSDFRRLCKGQFQIVCVPLHPPEQKIVYTNLENSVLEDPFEKLAAQVISIPVKKIEHYKQPEYDHYQQTLKELQLLIDNRNTSRRIRINGRRKKCSYKLVKNAQEIEDILKLNREDERQHTIAVLITIEGLHALGCGHVWHNDRENPFNVSDEELMERIDAIKGISSDNYKGWKISPMFFNVTHVFDNGYFGHAKGLGGSYSKIFDYAEPHNNQPNPGFSIGQNQPMSSFGQQIIKRLLGIDATALNSTYPGRRIIPDIKHMSTKTRRDYYQIVDDYNNDHPDDLIPIVMSHAAVNKKPTYSENHFDPIDDEQEYAQSKGFNPWSINLYDDEIIRIHETNGLIGIIFDERILAGKAKLKKLRDNEKPFSLYGKRMKWLLLIMDQIEHIIKTVQKSNTRTDKAGIWDRICIGSDFDGQINPINGYKKATDFSGLRSDLEKLLAEDRYVDIRMGIRIHELLEKICLDNVHSFLRRHYK